jgi:mannose-6-phosphate isomerase-like protein (cupin superfamily)
MAEVAAPKFEEPFDAQIEQVRNPQTFRYETPEFEEGKGLVKLAQTDIVKGAVQVVKAGGGNNLHSHAAADTFWMVLKGRARFYDGETDVFGEYGPMEGIVTPRGFAYWFESADPNQDLELLQVAGYEKGKKDVRTNHAPRTERTKSQSHRFNGRLTK